MHRLLFFWVGLALTLPGCVGREPQAEQAAPAGEPGDFEARLLEVGRSYESFGLFGKTGKWGIRDCIPEVVGHAPKFSGSGDQATHGRKLYWLFVKDLPDDPRQGYVPPGGVSPVGQVVVKEAWTPEEVEDKGRGLSTATTVTRSLKRAQGEVQVRFQPYVREGGRLYHAREKAGLFVMLKLDPGTPGTDAGWVYGTLTADGKAVTSAGRVESCMGCHKDAPHDRLFGAAGGRSP